MGKSGPDTRHKDTLNCYSRLVILRALHVRQREAGRFPRLGKGAPKTDVGRIELRVRQVEP